MNYSTRVPGICYLVYEHVFGKSERSFAIFESLVVFGGLLGISPAGKIREIRPPYRRNPRLSGGKGAEGGKGDRHRVGSGELPADAVCPAVSSSAPAPDYTVGY